MNADRFSVQCIDFENLPKIAWKNGLGLTREIFRRPDPDAKEEHFLWRLSLADVGASGPFSFFPNYQRILIQLSGGGMVLTSRSSGESKTLNLMEAFRFSGAEAIDCSLLAGPTRDLNFIYANGRPTPDVKVQTAVDPGVECKLDFKREDLLILVFSGMIDVQIADQAFELTRGTVLWLKRHSASAWEAQPARSKIPLTLRCSGSRPAALVLFDA